MYISICDDEPQETEYLSTLVSKWGRLYGYPCEIKSFPSAEAFLFSYAENRICDILLLDVEMSGISGVELAKRIREDKSRTEIIFITSHTEFIGEGYEVDALHYLVKPVAGDRLMPVLSKAAGRLSAEPPSVVITCEHETIKLYETDILYVESFLHYISIHTGKREYRIKENISSFAARLSPNFFRIHRSYLVSLKYVTRISRTFVTVEDSSMKEAIELPLARGKYDEINRAFISRN